MNFNDLPTYQPNINKLKDDLKSACAKYAITKFEAEDIVELLEDGESVDWIVNQLQAENAEIDIDSLSSLLNNIRTIVAPAIEEEELAEEEADEPEVAEETMPDLSELDFSQVKDLPLPDGMQLPPGVGMEQIQKLMKSPQGEFLADFSVFCQEKGSEVTESALSDPSNLKVLNEEWMSTPRDAFEGKTPAEMLAENPALMPQKVETFRHEEPRVGRNDPCPCGSGKKYKKCCGRGK